MTHRRLLRQCTFCLITILLTTVLGIVQTRAQELNASVNVNSQQLRQSDAKIFKTLEISLREFLNSTTWTDLNYEPEERINCSFQLTLTKEEESKSGQSNFRYTANLLVQSSRPVYGTDYETVMLSFNDPEIKFSYEEFQPLQKVENSFQDNLSAVFSYYAYLIIGLDMDSFSSNGGEPYFGVAESIRNAAPINSGKSYPGWNSSNPNNRNRYNLLEELLSAKFNRYREAMYTYHRKGLDILAEEPDLGRENIFQTLQEINYVFNTTSNQSILSTVLMSAKASEISRIFEPAPVTQRRKVYDMMIAIDPSSREKFKTLQ